VKIWRSIRLSMWISILGPLCTKCQDPQSTQFFVDPLRWRHSHHCRVVVSSWITACTLLEFNFHILVSPELILAVNRLAYPFVIAHGTMRWNCHKVVVCSQSSILKVKVEASKVNPHSFPWKAPSKIDRILFLTLWINAAIKIGVQFVRLAATTGWALWEEIPVMSTHWVEGITEGNRIEESCCIVLSYVQTTFHSSWSTPWFKFPR
jgi:hypothetical protein